MSSYAMMVDGEVLDRVTIKQVRARYPALPEAADLDALTVAFDAAERDLFDETGVFAVADPEDAAPELVEGETFEASAPIEREDGSWGRDWIVHRWLEVFAPGKLYARLNGEQRTFPYTLAMFRADRPAVARRLPPFKQMDDEWGIVEVDAADAPEAGPNQVAEPDGIELADGRWRQAWTLRDRTADELAELEAALLPRIDREAGAFRLRFITDVPGQSMTYEQKALEAEAWSADPEGDFPILSAEAAASGMTIADVAGEVLATAAQWRALAAAIEGARMGAKRAVRSAETYAGKIAAAEVDWEALLPVEEQE